MIPNTDLSWRFSKYYRIELQKKKSTQGTRRTRPVSGQCLGQGQRDGRVLHIGEGEKEEDCVGQAIVLGVPVHAVLPVGAGSQD